MPCLISPLFYVNLFSFHSIGTRMPQPSWAKNSQSARIELKWFDRWTSLRGKCVLLKAKFTEIHSLFGKAPDFYNSRIQI